MKYKVANILFQFHKVQLKVSNIFYQVGRDYVSIP